MFLGTIISGLSPFFMSCHFTKVFVHLSILAAVSNFNVYKLIECDPGNIYLFKANSGNTRKSYKNV